MRSEALKRLLDAIDGLRVLCVGDVVLDQYVYGVTRRVSREAPVPILDETRRENRLGAIGNVARNIKALGAHPILISVIGSDPDGQTLSRLLDAEGLGDCDLIAGHDRSTPVNTRFVCNGQQMFCVDRNPAGEIRREEESALIEAARDAVSDCDIAILGDYGRGMITPRLAQAVIQACREQGVRVCVDPSGRGYDRYDGAFLIKPNAEELADEARRPAETDAEVEAALGAVMEGLSQTDHLLVTRSSRGMSARDRAGRVTHHAARPREVFDVSGAGDTSIAAITLGIGADAALDEVMAFADLAAGVVVTKVGPAAVRPEELLADAEGDHSPKAGEKQISAEDAADIAARWRVRGFRVGFTTGCFDLLHPGHVSLLRQARNMCDRLIVGIYNDASTRRLKGPGRPVNDERARAAVISALDVVDRVVLIHEDHAGGLIEQIRPDVLVKAGAGSMTPLGPFASETVRGFGGEIRSARLEAGYSTDGVLARMNTPAPSEDG